MGSYRRSFRSRAYNYSTFEAENELSNNIRLNDEASRRLEAALKNLIR